MATFFNLARMTVSSTGTGDITLNAAVTGFLTFDQAGCSTAAAGQPVVYAINEATQSEIGTGIYYSSGPYLRNRTPYNSTNGNATIAMSNAAQVFITPSAADYNIYNSAVMTSSVQTFASSNQAIGLSNISAVGYSTAQTLTSSEYAQALTNLHAVSYSSQATALTSAQFAQALTNITAVSYSSQATALSSTQTAQALTNITAVSYSSLATALTSAQFSQALANIKAISFSSQATALTSAQMAQALTNLSAVSYSSLATALTSAQQAQAQANLGITGASTTTVLYSSNNLSDLSSVATARTNLGLGTAAVQNVGAFLQPANNLSDVSNAATARSNLGISYSAGTVGSYAMCFNGNTISFGGATAGAGLTTCSADGSGAVAGLAGTWTCMGGGIAGSSIGPQGITIYVRTA